MLVQPFVRRRKGGRVAEIIVLRGCAQGVTQFLQIGIRIAECLVALWILRTKYELRFQRIFQIDRKVFAECQLVRRHAVEHDAAYRVGMVHRVLLDHARAVGNADQIERRRTERLAHRFQILNRIRRRVRAWIGSFFHPGQTLAHMGADRVEIKAILIRILGRVATQWMRATRTALVEQKNVVVFAQRRERAGDLRPGVNRSLSRAAGEIDDNVGVCGFGVAANQGKLEIDLAVAVLIRAGRVAVFRHAERRAECGRGCTGFLLRQLAGLELQHT